MGGGAIPRLLFPINVDYSFKKELTNGWIYEF